MSEHDLKPCPFCGPGQSVISLWFDDVVQRFRVGCGRCGCSTGTDARDKTEAPAIKAWNTRGAEEVERERANIADNAAEYMYQIALRGGKTPIPRDVFVSVLAHLVSAHSLLRGGGKKAAASDTIFGIMLIDMQNAIDAGRNAIKGKP